MWLTYGSAEQKRVTDLNDLGGQIAITVAKDAYRDLVSSALRVVGKISEDAAKTVRLILFPLQVGAALQDRLAGFIDRAVRAVPEERRIAPATSLALQIGERLRLQEEGDPITEMYVRLLSRAFDRDRVGEAHPAFVHLIGQLAPDEAILLEQLAALDKAAYIRIPRGSAPVLRGEREALGALPDLVGLHHELMRLSLRPEELAQPELLFTYVEHLVSLGIVIYTDEYSHEDLQRDLQAAVLRAGGECWFLQLNQFGRLFHSACVGAPGP